MNMVMEWLPLRLVEEKVANFLALTMLKLGWRTVLWTMVTCGNSNKFDAFVNLKNHLI
jgi:hypothetical protein